MPFQKKLFIDCSPRPENICNPSSPTASVTSTMLSSSPKHLNEPAPQQQITKNVVITSLGTITLLIIIAQYFRQKKIWRRRNRDCNMDNITNVEEEGYVYFEKCGKSLSNFLVCISRSFLFCEVTSEP